MKATAHLAALIGLTSVAACERLADLAAQVPADQAVVEVGVFKGRSACYLAFGALHGKGARVWAIDPWDLPGKRRSSSKATPFSRTATRRKFRRQVRSVGLEDRITAVRAFSVDAAHDWQGPPVGLLHVDGDHRERAVRADWEAWRPHLATGAVVVFDDYNDRPEHAGVRAVVDSLVELRPVTHELGRLAVGRLR